MIGKTRLARGRHRDWRVAAAFVAPTFTLVSVFVLVPLVSSTRLAFFSGNRFGRVGGYVGLRNVRSVLTSPEFRASGFATFRFVLLVAPTSVVLGIALAVVAAPAMRGASFFRVVFSSSVATGGALSAALFTVLLTPTGTMRYLLQSAHVLRPDQTINLLNNDRWALPTIAAVTVWSNLGFSFIVFSAALRGVPETLYESAALEGCGAWAKFRHITVPMIRPTIEFAAIAMTVGALLSFGQIDVLTRGGPGQRTDVLAYALYRTSFRDGDQAKGAVYSATLLLLCAVLGAAQLFVFRRRRSFDDG